MARVLYIESSPRKNRSSSIAIANAFLNQYRQNHPKDDVKVVDLWKEELPPFDGDVIDAKYALLHNQTHTDKQSKAWKAIENVITQFKEADKYVISLPMWNFGIPYKLKHYFDVIVQPGLTFKYSPEKGYEGLVTGKKALLIFSRGGAYGAETGGQQLDLQKRYMETIMQFIGFKDIQSIIIEPTLASPETKEQVVAQAKKQALDLASSF